MAERDDDQVERTLQRIATQLGISVAQFHEDHLPAQLVGTDAWLLLSGRLRTDEGRRRALAALRQIADDETK